MEYIAIIISLIALVGAGFAFIRANSSHNILSKRIETLKDRNSAMEARLRKTEGSSGKSNRPANEGNVETNRRNQPRQEQQEPRQNQVRQEQQNEPRQKQPRPEQQEQRQKQRERPQQQQQQQQQPQQNIPVAQQSAENPRQPEQRRKKENRRRNEPMERTSYGDLERDQLVPNSNAIKLEIAGGDLLDELEQAAGNNTSVSAPVEKPYSGKKYAIIPEDGVIRMHQLQQQPDSDSYIEVDPAADGNSSTHYRFNLAGNHAFVIAQGIDRLENAFDFEKPSNRMVTKVVQQQDGVLTKVNNGWKIMEKARIDFR